MTSLDGPAALLTREPAHRVSPRAKLMWTVSEAVSGAIGVAVAIWVWTRDWIPAPWGTVLLGLLIAEVIVSAVVVPQWRYRVHRWEVTDDAVYTQRGWLNQERRIAPMNRIQTVDIDRGPFAQLFRLSTVTITTASARGALKIDGLDMREAAELTERLTRLAAADEGDGT